MTHAADSTAPSVDAGDACTPRAAETPALRYLLYLVLSALITALYIQASFTSGRLSQGIPVFDDLSYFEDALMRLQLLYDQGIGAMTQAHWRQYVHSPWSTYGALVGYGIFGRTLWAPYAVNAVLIWLALALMDRMFRKHSTWVRLALGLTFITMPLSASLVLDCRPDAFCALLIAAGLWRLAEVPLEAMRPSQAAWVGLFWGATMWVKPTVFVQTGLFFVGALAWGWLQAWFTPTRCWRTLARNSFYCFGVAALVAAPHMLPHLRAYFRYMMLHMFGAGREFWLLRVDPMQHLTFYTTGNGGQYMFGDTFYWLAAVLTITCIVAYRRGSAGLFRQLLALTAFCGMCWFLPTVNGVKSGWFGMAFGCLFLFTFLRCCAAWIGGELRIARRPAWAAGLAALAVVASYWKMPTHGWGQAPQDISYAAVIRNVYEEVRARTARGQATSIVFPSVGHLNASCVRWHFRADLRAAPRLHDLWMSPSLEAQLRQCEGADLIVVPEPGVDSWLVQEEKASSKWRGELIARLDHDDRFRLCCTVPATNGKRVLLYERHGPFAGCSPGRGLHAKTPKRMIAVQPVSRILVPTDCQHKATLSLKVRSIVPGQFLTLRSGAQELARLDLQDLDTWRQVNLQLTFEQAAHSLELVCSTGQPHQPILEFEEIRLRPSDAEANHP